MNRLLVVLAVMMLLSPVPGYTGGWGVGSFDNDDALDFIFLFEEEPSIDLLLEALQFAAKPQSYLQAPDGASAIAAAEILAAMNDKPAPELSEGAGAWASGQEPPSDSALALARNALTAVASTESSEIAQLYTVNDEMFTEWEQCLSELKMRLE